MRLEEKNKIYTLAGNSEPVEVVRIWDDGDANDWISEIEINGVRYRVEGHGQSQSRHSLPGAFWILQRLGNIRNVHVQGGHNCREDALTLDGKNVWIVDEPDDYVVKEYYEYWTCRELLDFHALFTVESMMEYALRNDIELPEEGPLETPIGSGVFHMTY